MGQQNGYIQVEIKNAKALCHIYPPVEGGKPLRMTDAEEFLRSHNISKYDRQMLKELIERGDQSSMYLGECDGEEFPESMYTKISLDKMKVTCRFMPPTKGGNLLQIKDIMEVLTDKGVIIGVDQDEILKFTKERLYATEYVFARGKAPVIGHDAKIEYTFNTNPSLKPKHNEDGSVDFHNLNTISVVYEGDVLARMIDLDPGEPGQDITGREIPTRKTKPVHFRYGKNVRLSDDGKELISEVTGHAALAGGKVIVSQVYEVAGDVDNSVGNIDYNGDVHIKGNVRSGFSILAQGDVVVDGVVEGALIQADGQIIVKQGIHGMQKGILDARGNVICQFIENAKVFSGGYVETGSIIYSEVNASEDVNVLAQKGFIVGGVIRAGSKVESMIIGSQMGAHTTIEVGMAPEKKERYSQLHRSIQAMVKKIDKLNPIIETYNEFVQSGKELDDKNRGYLEKLVNELVQTKNMLSDARLEYNALNQELINSKHSKVVVQGEIFPQVEIVVSDISLMTKTKRTRCQYTKRNGEISVSSF